MSDDDLHLLDGTVLPARELQVRFARAGGPGGQHVNTSATRVELRFDVAGSDALSATQKQRITATLGSRLSRDGVLVLHADEFRSQARNRAAARLRLRRLLDDALRRRAPRRSTRVPQSSRRARREDKRRRSRRKRERRRPGRDEV